MKDLLSRVKLIAKVKENILLSQDLEKKVDFYTKNQSAREEKQRLGVEYAKNKGTYFHVAKDFLDKITN